MGRVYTWNIAIVVAVVLLDWSGFSQGLFYSTNVSIDDDYKDCTAFLDLNYSFDQYPHNRTVVLQLKLTRHVPDINITLHSTDYELSCNTGSSIPGNFTDQNTAEPSHVEYYEQHGVLQHSVKQHYVFHNVSGKNFCARLLLNRCGELLNTVHTYTAEFEGPAPPPLEVETRQPVVMILICMSLIIAALIALAAYCINRNTSYFRRHGILRTTFTERPDGDGISTSPLLEAPPATSAILLLYSRDSDGFVRLMAAFRNLLTALTGIEVLDPLDSCRLEEVFRDPPSWLARHLRRHAVKVVLVESAGAVALQRALLSGRAAHLAAGAAPNALDGLFTHALHDMQGDCRIGGDYRRVYRVRFEGITTTAETLSHIVPMRDFHLMRHIGRLIHEIKGETYPSDADDVTHSQELLRNIPEAENLSAVLRELTDGL